MAYATKQDLIDRYGLAELIELTDRADPPAGIVDDTVVDKALADAGAIIDSYIGARYDLPLAATPARLVQLAAEIARYLLFKDGATEKAKDDYESATAFLRDVAAGKAVLDAGGEEPAVEGGTASIKSAERVFSRKTLDGF